MDRRAWPQACMAGVVLLLSSRSAAKPTVAVRFGASVAAEQRTKVRRIVSAKATISGFRFSPSRVDDTSLVNGTRAEVARSMSAWRMPLLADCILVVANSRDVDSEVRIIALALDGTVIAEVDVGDVSTQWVADVIMDAAEHRATSTSLQDDKSPALSYFSLSAGYELSGRYFTYAGTPSTSINIRDYSHFGISAGFFSASFWPLAHTDAPILASLGVDAVYSHSASFSSDTAVANYPFETQYNRLVVAALYRGSLAVSSGRSYWLQFGPLGGYYRFALSPRGNASNLIRDEVSGVEYGFVGARVAGRLPIVDHLEIQPSVEGIIPFGFTRAYAEFDSVHAGAVSVQLNLLVSVDAGLGVQLGGVFTHLFADVASNQSAVPVDEFVAEHHLAMRVGATYVFEVVSPDGRQPD